MNPPYVGIHQIIEQNRQLGVLSIPKSEFLSFHLNSGSVSCPLNPLGLPQFLVKLLEQCIYLLLGDFCLLALEVSHQEVNLHLAGLPEID